MRCKWCRFSVPLSCSIAGRQNELSQCNTEWKEAINVSPDSIFFSAFSSKTVFILESGSVRGEGLVERERSHSQAVLFRLATGLGSERSPGVFRKLARILREGFKCLQKNGPTLFSI